MTTDNSICNLLVDLEYQDIVEIIFVETIFFLWNKIHDKFLIQVFLFQTFNQLTLQSLENVHFVEISDSLSKIQTEKLCVYVQYQDSKSNF